MIWKLKSILSILFILTALLGFSQQVNSIEKGDSLFVARKYTEAFKVYEGVLNNGQSSSAMFLKMAFIKEGLKDYVNALYYLNEYYEVTSDKSVLLKMQEIAVERDLTGYEVGDKDFFMTNLMKFKQEIQLGLVFVSLVLLLVGFRAKVRRSMPIGIPVMQILLMAALFLVANDWFKPNKAIVNNATVLMSGPSAASEILEPIKRGHQVEILDESDVWTKIIWEGREAYIRNGKLLKL